MNRLLLIAGLLFLAMIPLSGCSESTGSTTPENSELQSGGYPITPPSSKGPVFPPGSGPADPDDKCIILILQPTPWETFNSGIDVVIVGIVTDTDGTPKDNELVTISITNHGDLCNFVDIGAATLAADGTFSFVWTPIIPGDYDIKAEACADFSIVTVSIN